jgi:AraC-like DNA-binding protein
MQNRFLQTAERALMLRYEEIQWKDSFPFNSRIRITVGSEPIRQLHIHQGLEIGFCHSGKGYLCADNKVFTYQEGDIMIVSQREAHAYRSNKGTQSLCSFIHMNPGTLVGMGGEFSDLLRVSLLGGPDFPNVIVGSQYPEIFQIVQLLLAELEIPRNDQQAVMRSLATGLLGYLFRLPGIEPSSSRRTPDALQRVSPALHHIAYNYAATNSVEELAECCHLSESHFRKLFREAVGISAHRYLTNVRLHMGAYLLRTTNKTILQIAQEVGCGDISSFNRHFRENYECTPRQWRQEVRAISE